MACANETVLFYDLTANLPSRNASKVTTKKIVLNANPINIYSMAKAKKAKIQEMCVFFFFPKLELRL